MRVRWDEWFKNGENGVKHLTKLGFRQKPSYQWMVNSVSESLKALPKDKIAESFVRCGITSRGQDFDNSYLHSTLRDLLLPDATQEIVQLPDSDSEVESAFVFVDSDGEAKNCESYPFLYKLL